jgi:hypothetical protein
MHGMSASDPSDPDVVDPLSDDPLAFLYEAGEEEEDEDSTADHPGYGSLMGVGVRRVAGEERPAKKMMAIVLDELEAQRAAEVMEINAGQLMTNPDRSSRQIGFQSLGLDAGDEGAEEDDLAESLNWEAAAEEEDDGDWQPTNPLAGTGIVEDDEDDWQPSNPLAGTGIVQYDDEDDWQPENPLAGTEFEGHDDWPAVEEPASQAPTPLGFAEAAYDDWNEPVPPVDQLPEAPLPAVADAEDDWQAASAAPSEAAAPFEEVEWEAPTATVPEAEELPVAAEALSEAPAFPEEEPLPEAAEAAPVEWQPVAEDIAQDVVEEGELADEPAEQAPIAWESLLVRKSGKRPVDLGPIDWDEFAEDAHAGEAPVEPAAFDHGWAEEAAETPEPPTLPPEPIAPDWQAFSAEEEIEEKVAIAANQDEWLPPVETAEEESGPYDTEWSAFVEPADDYAVSEPILPSPPEPEPEPEQIEVVRFPAPPVVEAPHHSLRAKVMKAQQPRTTQASKVKPALDWLAAQFRQFVLPQLKRLFAWASTKWSEIASRPPRD